MSTKIYNGYKIPGKSLDEVIGKLFLNKEKLVDLIENKIREDILYRAFINYHNMCFSNFLDNEKSIDKDNDKSPFGLVISEALENERIFELKEQDTIDISICFFPQQQSFGNETYYLLMLFAGNESKLMLESSIWKDLKIEEFTYWDNTDPLETVTEYEWDMREKQWSNVLGKSYKPSENSLILELKKEYKYNCVYFRNKEELRVNFEKNIENVNLKIKNKEQQLLNYYEESLKEKLAYKLCSPKSLEEKTIDNLNDEEKNKLYQEVRKKTRANDFTEIELNDISLKLEKIKKVLDNSLTFDDLFEKKEEIKKKSKELLNIKKLKV